MELELYVHHMAHRDQTQVIRLSGKCLYLLNYLTCLINVFQIFFDTWPHYIYLPGLELTILTRLAWNSLGLKICATMPGMFLFLHYVYVSLCASV